MTPKEKAKELYFKYYQQVADGSFPEYNAKQCALIAVNEIIDQWEYIYVHIADGMGELNPNLKYWYEVKHELNKSE